MPQNHCVFDSNIHRNFGSSLYDSLQDLFEIRGRQSRLFSTWTLGEMKYVQDVLRKNLYQNNGWYAQYQDERPRKVVKSHRPKVENIYSLEYQEHLQRKERMKKNHKPVKAMEDPVDMYQDPTQTVLAQQLLVST